MLKTYVCVHAHVCVKVCHVCAGARRDRKWALDPWSWNDRCVFCVSVSRLPLTCHPNR